MTFISFSISTENNQKLDGVDPLLSFLILRARLNSEFWLAWRFCFFHNMLTWIYFLLASPPSSHYREGLFLTHTRTLVTSDKRLLCHHHVLNTLVVAVIGGLIALTVTLLTSILLIFVVFVKKWNRGPSIFCPGLDFCCQCLGGWDAHDDCPADGIFEYF